MFHVLDGGLSNEAWAKLETTLRGLHPLISLDRLKIDDGLFEGLPEYHGRQMTYARLLWHAFYAKYPGMSRWQSLRDSLSIGRLLLVRSYWHLIRCPLTRWAFFVFLRLLGHQKCPPIMLSKCLT